MIRLNNNGITLVELLVGIILIGVVFMIVTTLVVQSFDIFRSSTDRMNANQLIELAQSEIVGCLRAAYSGADEDINRFGENRDYWQFKSRCPDGNEVVYRIRHENSELNIYIGKDVNSLSLERRVIGNVSDFYLDKDDNIFTVFIETEVDGSSAEKTIKVSSRN